MAFEYPRRGYRACTGRIVLFGTYGYILYLGRLVPEKGILYLMDAFQKIKTDKKLVIAGGVSANSLLRRTLEEECLRRGRQFFKPDKSLCGDNAAMIGAQAYFEVLAGNFADETLNAYASDEEAAFV